MLMMVGIANDPMRRGTGAVVIRVYLSFFSLDMMVEL